jgi:hypothetical protein
MSLNNTGFGLNPSRTTLEYPNSIPDGVTVYQLSFPPPPGLQSLKMFPGNSGRKGLGLEEFIIY